MSSQKDIPRQKKTAAECALLLHEWVRIVKELNPNKRTENPFCEELEQMTRQLQISEGFLLKDLLHSITLMNRESRTNGKGELISTHADLLNALRLILPSTKRIGTREAEALEILKAWFGEENFTYYEASLRLRCSHTTAKRYIQRLLAHGLIEKLPEPTGHRTQLRITAATTSIDIQKEDSSIYDQAMEEWTDFEGFTELGYRT